MRGIVDGEATVMNRQITSMREILGCVEDDFKQWLDKASLFTSTLAEDRSFDVVMTSSWRTDKAMNIEKPDFVSYLEKLAATTGTTEINCFADVKEVLSKRMDYFAAMV